MRNIELKSQELHDKAYTLATDFGKQNLAATGMEIMHDYIFDFEKSHKREFNIASLRAIDSEEYKTAEFIATYMSDEEVWADMSDEEDMEEGGY